MPDRAQFRDAGRYVAAVASEVARPALRAYARARARGAPTAPHAWRRGVILGASHIGDVLYRTCSLPQLAAGLPQCRWTYVTSEAGAELLAGNPAVADVMVIGDGDPRLVHALRAAEFDVALCTDNIEHHRALLATVAATIPNRVAFASKGLSGLASLPVYVGRDAWPAQFRSMVQTVTGIASAWPLRPRVFVSAEDRAAASAVWDVLPWPDATLTIAVSVATRQRIGVFPPALFANVITRAAALEPRLRVLLTGAAADRPALEAIRSEVGSRCSVVAGALALRPFVALLERCHAFLGSDSGPRHMANAAGIPVYFVRNMAVPEIEAGRYCNTEVDLAPPGQYLGAAANGAALEHIDPSAAAASLVETARRYSATAH